MRRMALDTSDIVTPVFASTKIVVRLLAGMTRETCFRRSLGIKILQNDYLRFIAAAVDMVFTGSVARFASDDLSFP